MKKLYALITNRDGMHGYGAVVVQVSFNEEELIEIANYLNTNIKYFCPNAFVKEVDENVCEWYWPRSSR